MKLAVYEGYMIPGIHFHNCSIWIINWVSNPTVIKNMSEIWVLMYTGEKICYISSNQAIPVFEKYHSFDKVVPANISLMERDGKIKLKVISNNKEVLSLSLTIRKTFKYCIINFILRHRGDKVYEHGKTETGRAFQNIPHKIERLFINNAEYNDKKLSLIKMSPIEFALGDGKPSSEPIINYCIHKLEE
jgi:hypothetical protein